MSSFGLTQSVSRVWLHWPVASVLTTGQVLQATSNDIASKVEEAERTEQEIDAAREQYRSVAVRGSLLFFCIADLAGVDPMYQYSLAWFVALFLRTVQATPEVRMPQLDIL